MRKAWEACVQSILPHASRQISNFMFACFVEGRTRDQVGEAAFKRGDAGTCELTKDEISALMNAAKQRDKGSAEQESSTGARARSAPGSAASGRARRIAAATSLALRLADASKSSEEVSSARAKNLLRGRRVGAPVRKGQDAEGPGELRRRAVTAREHDRRAACA